ncbi:MAG: hypothetical protein ABFR53_09095 [Actinomycetota bacterium]
MRRTVFAIGVTSLLAALIYVGSFSFWLDREIVDSENFLDSAVEALGTESSRDAIGQLIVDGLIEEFPLLTILESNLVGMFSDLLASPALGDVVTLVGVNVHERIVTGNQDAIVIDLIDYRDVIVSPIEAVAPRLAELIPDEWFASIEVLEAGVLPDLSTYAERVGLVRWVSLVGAFVLIALLMWLVRRTTATTLIGIAFVLAGVASAALVPAGRILTVAQFEDRSVQTLSGNAYGVFVQPLLVGAAVLVLIGISVIVAGVALGASDDDGQAS